MLLTDHPANQKSNGCVVGELHEPNIELLLHRTSDRDKPYLPSKPAQRLQHRAQTCVTGSGLYGYSGNTCPLPPPRSCSSPELRPLGAYVINPMAHRVFRKNNICFGTNHQVDSPGEESHSIISVLVCIALAPWPIARRETRDEVSCTRPGRAEAAPAQ